MSTLRSTRHDRPGGGRREGGAAGVWARCLHNALADRAAYRFDFFLGLGVNLLFEAVAPVVTWLIYRASAGSGFPGWTLEEALVIQGVFLLARGLGFTVFQPLVWTVNNMVRSGTFEVVLLKPRNPLLVCMTRSVNLQSLGTAAGGALVTGWALSQCGGPGPGGWIAFALLLGMSLCVLFAFSLISAATLFVWVGNGRMEELLEALYQFARYPMGIYQAGLRLVLSVVIPLGALAWFPALALLGRLGSPAEALATLGPGLAGAAFFLALGLGLWNFMIRRYSGAGG